MGKTIVIAAKAENKSDIESCLKIREEVFIQEQQVPAAIERDAFDQTCDHFLARVDAAPVGTGRLRPKGSFVKFERIATVKASRGLGVGRVLVEEMVRYAQTNYPELLPMMHAQQDAITFYAKLGWKEVGPEFFEADILHKMMIFIPEPNHIPTLKVWTDPGVSAEILGALKEVRSVQK